MNRFLKLVLASLLVLVFFASLGLAQTSKGTIAGTVYDNTGAVLPGASVTAKSVETGEARTVITGAAGSFRIDAVNPGTFKLSISKEGFKTSLVESVAVQASVVTPVDSKLQVGSVATTVTVEALNNEIQTENAEISGNVSSEELASLPNAGLNPISLAVTLPGVVDITGRNVAQGAGFSVNGLNPRENNFLIDGYDNNDNSVQGQAFQPINSAAIQEVTTLTNSYSAEFGRGGASVTNVVYKGGSNRFHGTVSELYQGSGLDAVDAQAGLQGVTSRTKTRYDQHTYGFTVGGPIVKNKLFFFATSQWVRFYGNTSGGTILAPTAAGIAELNAYGTPNAALMAQYFGGLRATDPNSFVNVYTGNQAASIGTPVQFGKVQRVVPLLNPDTQWNFKIDYLLTQKDVIAFRFLHDRGSMNPDFYNIPNTLPGFETEQGGPGENAGLTYTHTFNPKAINELRASYGHFQFEFAPTASTLANPLYTLPRISLTLPVTGTFPLLGVPTNMPQGRGHQIYQFQDTLTYLKGAHTFKFGADIARLLIKDDIPFNFFGQGTYTSSASNTSLGNFLDNYSGTTGTFAKTFGNPEIRPRAMQQAFFLDDTWKVRSGLTLTLGLRYEFQPNPANNEAYPGYDTKLGAFGSLTTPYKVREDGNNFAPRVGIAYTPHFMKGLFGENKTVIRAGYGVFYDTIYTNIIDNIAGSAPNAIATTIVGNSAGRGTPNASAIIPAMTPVLNPTTASQTSVATGLKNPLIQQWNINIQRELPGNMLFAIAYVGSRGERLLETELYNPFGGLNAASLAAGNLVRLPRLNPARGAITVRENSGDSIYHGANAKLERRFAHGLMFRSAYTLGKAIDNGSDVFYNLGAGNGSGTVVPQNPYAGGRKAERGPSDFDIRHQWVNVLVWKPAGLKFGGNSLLKGASYLTRDWEFSTTTTLQSGQTYTPYMYGLDTNGDGNAYNGRPFVNNASAPMGTTAQDGIFSGDTPGVFYDVATGNPVANLSAYHFVVKPGNGDAGRNSWYGPGLFKSDVSFARGVKITESQKLTFRGEFYNIFNHPDYNYGIDSSVLDAGFGSFEKTPSREGHRSVHLFVKYEF